LRKKKERNKLVRIEICVDSCMREYKVFNDVIFPFFSFS
jgi:hypothetical protein